MQLPISETLAVFANLYVNLLPASRLVLSAIHKSVSSCFNAIQIEQSIRGLCMAVTNQSSDTVFLPISEQKHV